MNAVVLATSLDLQWIVWPTLALVFALGLLAAFAPRKFQSIAAHGGRWIDTERVLQALDKPIDVDRHVLRYSRVFGVAVALAAVWLAYVYWVFVR